MRLPDLVAALGADATVIDRGRDLEAIDVVAVAYDSRHAPPGSLFCCVPGAQVDGHDFAAAAVAGGAVALLVEHALDVDAPQIVVADARRAMAVAAAAVHGHPSEALTVIGVTGTNGKTTMTHLLANIFAMAGRRTAVLGTLSGARTTPEAPDLQRWFVEQRDAGVDTVAIEVSSHALALRRVDGTRFDAAVFTNLSRDHLDFHGSMEAYFEEKSRLFAAPFTELAIVNTDDPYGRLLRDAATIRTVGYSLDDVIDLRVEAAASTFRWRDHPVRLPMGGRFNVSNAAGAAATAAALGVADDVIAAGLGCDISVPGRFEVIDEGQPFSVIVDYAHTPDALERLLLAAREVAGQGQVVVVFGCGGDRDATKRPAMGEAAARHADRVILTADNSRHEDTTTIISAVQNGYDHAAARTARELAIEPDRRAAIALAISGAAPGDVVVIAGKGHESTQTIGDTVTPFDDRAVARDELQAAGHTGGGAA